MLHVRGRTALAAAYVATGAQMVRVRHPDKKLRHARVDARFAGGSANSLVNVPCTYLFSPADRTQRRLIEPCHGRGGDQRPDHLRRQGRRLPQARVDEPGRRGERDGLAIFYAQRIWLADAGGMHRELDPYRINSGRWSTRGRAERA